MVGQCKPAAFLIICLLLALVVPGSSPLLAQDEESTDGHIGWPRDLDTEKGVVTVYQPQIESFEGDYLESRAAVSVKVKGKDDPPVFGAVWFKARMATDMDTRMVTLASLEVPNAKFPNASDENIQKLQTFLEEEIPKWDMTFELDRLLASVHEIEERRKNQDNLKNDPPDIIYRDKAAVLVLIDGDPKLTELEGYDLQIVVNTAFFIVQDKSKRYYLKGGTNWFSSMDLLKDWEMTTSLPDEVVEVNKKIEEEAEKARKENPEEAAEVEKEKEEVGEPEIPEIIVRTQPAELVTTYGDPDMAPVEGTELLYVKNSESDIVFEIASQNYYLLLSGRWFKATSLTEGGWAFVPFEELPEEFEKIPETSDMSTVRVSIPGTDEAKEAVLANDIPQTAEVSRADAKLEVTYDGDPTFETCTDNGVSYAVNTDKAVLLIDGTYYACDDAIWFVSQGPEGPWAVADEVPEKVQDIPPECPVYNVKYVYIYESTPEVVYVGYTSGYVGSYYYGGCVVYGTGWWYRPWYSYYYYPRPVTYGFGVHWTPYTGWGFHFGVSYGWLHIGVGWGRPWYGGWYGGYWGARGYRYGYRHGYHHGYRHGYRHGARAGYRAGYRAGSRHRNNNIYRNRSTGVKSTGARNRAGASTRPSTGGGSPGARPSTGANQRPSTGANQRPSAQQKKQPQRSNKSNNVYTDRNGNVSRNQGGSWQQSNGKGGWSSGGSGNRSNQQQLNRSQQSRSRGSTRSQGASRSRSGGSRGGGGRRR